MANTTTIITGTAGVVGTTAYTVDKDFKINRDKRNNVLATTLTTTATAIAEDYIPEKTTKKDEEKSSTSYIDSLSDSELALALEKLDLLEKEMNEESIKKI